MDEAQKIFEASREAERFRHARAVYQPFILSLLQGQELTARMVLGRVWETFLPVDGEDVASVLYLLVQEGLVRIAKIDYDYLPFIKCAPNGLLSAYFTAVASEK